MNKHAYLIMADSNFHQLRQLVKLLDDFRNDIFIHIDKKVNFDPKDWNINTKYSNLYFIPRIKVFWGGVSQIKCELELFEFAFNTEKYSYYHLLSGKDLPLQNQDYIHNFFKNHQGKEFVYFSSLQDIEVNKAYERINHYHVFPEISVRRYRNRILKFGIKIYRFLETRVQRLCKVNIQKNKNLKLGYGSNWVSISGSLVQMIVDEKQDILSTYNHSVLADEIFIQTFILNKKDLVSRVFVGEDGDYTRSYMRYIKFIRGKSSPKIWNYRDLEELIEAKNEGYLFARKFDENIDDEVIKEWIKFLKK